MQTVKVIKCLPTTALLHKKTKTAQIILLISNNYFIYMVGLLFSFYLHFFLAVTQLIQ